MVVMMKIGKMKEILFVLRKKSILKLSILVKEGRGLICVPLIEERSKNHS